MAVGRASTRRRRTRKAKRVARSYQKHSRKVSRRRRTKRAKKVRRSRRFRQVGGNSPEEWLTENGITEKNEQGIIKAVFEVEGWSFNMKTLNWITDPDLPANENRTRTETLRRMIDHATTLDEAPLGE